MKMLLMIAAALAISGCQPSERVPDEHQAGRFVFYPADRGLIDAGFLLDTATGRMWKLSGTAFEPLLSQPIGDAPQR